MSQSVKLKDGSYIDASGVWDNTQGSDLESLHEQMMEVHKYGPYTFTPSALGWQPDTANAIKLSKGTYIIRVYASQTSGSTADLMAFMLDPMHEQTALCTPDNNWNERWGCYIDFYRATADTEVTFRLYNRTTISPVQYTISYIKLTN